MDGTFHFHYKQLHCIVESESCDGNVDDDDIPTAYVRHVGALMLQNSREQQQKGFNLNCYHATVFCAPNIFSY